MADVRIGVQEINSTCEFIVALNDLDEWIYVDTPIGLSQPAWDYVPGLPLFAQTKTSIGRIPIRVGSEWVSAGLYNHADNPGDAFAIYRDPTYGNIAVKSWADRYPVSVSDDPVEGTPNSMPFANVSTTWGDYLILGDIQWKSDSTLPYSSSNTARYPHGIWFSRPGAPDTFHPNDVFFVGQKLSANAILGMFALDVGLVVVSQSSISVLRGRPGPAAEDFVYEELRTGISPETKNEVAFWAEAGLVVWIDRRIEDALSARFHRDGYLRPEFVVHPSPELGPPVMQPPEESHYGSAHHDVMKVRDHEIGVVKMNVGRQGAEEHSG